MLFRKLGEQRDHKPATALLNILRRCNAEIPAIGFETSMALHLKTMQVTHAMFMLGEMRRRRLTPDGKILVYLMYAAVKTGLSKYVPRVLSTAAELNVKWDIKLLASIVELTGTACLARQVEAIFDRFKDALADSEAQFEDEIR